MLVQLDENRSVNTSHIVGTYIREPEGKEKYKLEIHVTHGRPYLLEFYKRWRVDEAQHYLNFASQFSDMATAEAKDMDINDDPAKTIKEYVTGGNDGQT